MFGASGCIALAGLAATGLFAGLAFVQAMAGLDGIRD